MAESVQLKHLSADAKKQLKGNKGATGKTGVVNAYLETAMWGPNHALSATADVVKLGAVPAGNYVLTINGLIKGGTAEKATCEFGTVTDGTFTGSKWAVKGKDTTPEAVKFPVDAQSFFPVAVDIAVSAADTVHPAISCSGAGSVPLLSLAMAEVNTLHSSKVHPIADAESAPPTTDGSGGSTTGGKGTEEGQEDNP